MKPSRSFLIAPIRPTPRKISPRVELNEARAGLDLREGGGAGVDAADADQRKRAFGAHISLREHAGRQREQRPARRARPAPVPCRFRAGAAGRSWYCRRSCRRPGGGAQCRRHRRDRRASGRARSSAGPVCGGVFRGAFARVDHACEQVVERGRLLQVAQARRVGRRDIDGQETRVGRKRLQAGDIVGGAVDGILVGAEVDADDAVCLRARRAAGAPRRAPSLLKPNRLITASSASSRNRRGRGLPGWGFGVTPPASTNPKPSRNSASVTSAFLSNPAANPTGLGKVSPNACTRSFSSSAEARGNGASFNALSASACACLRDRACAAAARPAGRTARSRFKLRKYVAPIRAEPQRLHPAHRRERQAGHRDAETAHRHARARSAANCRAPRASTATRTRSVLPAKCRAAVSRTCAAVEKWM